MRYSQLFEHYVNLFSPEDKQKYADEVWNVLQTSYANAGGFHSADSPEDLIGKTGMWKLVTRNGKVSALTLYKDALGRKSIASGTDGTDQGRKDFLKITDEDLKLNRAWAEVSGVPEKMLKRAKATPIPNSLAGVLTGKEIIDLNPDGFHYTRMISGHPHEKIIYGLVELTPEAVATLEKNGIDLSEFPANIKMPK